MEGQETQAKEIWQVDLDGHVRDLSFNELVILIQAGSLLPQNKIRRGNLRWLEAGRVSAVAGYFSLAQENLNPPHQQSNIGPGDGRPQAVNPVSVQAVSTTGFINSVLIIVILSFALTFLWTYYRERADEIEQAAIPGAPPAQTTAELLTAYQKEQNSLSELTAENEVEMARLSSDPPRWLVADDINKCYRIRYNLELPMGHPQLNGRAPVEIGRELDEECAARQRKVEADYAQMRESDLSQRKNDLLGKRNAFAARLTDLDEKIAAAQTRLNRGFFGVALEPGFYWSFAPIFLFVIILNFFRLFLKKKISEPLAPLL